MQKKLYIFGKTACSKLTQKKKNKASAQDATSSYKFFLKYFFVQCSPGLTSLDILHLISGRKQLTNLNPDQDTV